MKEINQDKIDRYLLEKMSTDERASFQKEIKTNEELRQEVDHQKEAINLIREHGRQETKAWIKNIVRNTDTNDETLPIPPRRIFLKIAGVAASIALLIGVVFLIKAIIDPPTSDPIALFKQHYQPFSETQLNSSADKAYHEANYKEALSIFEQNSTLDIKQQLMLGICYLETRDYSNAIQQFQKNYDNISYGNEAKWYAALTYLKQKKHLESKNLLKQIQTGKLKEQAQELIQELEKI